jgi:hypothetical protein
MGADLSATTLARIARTARDPNVRELALGGLVEPLLRRSGSIGRLAMIVFETCLAGHQHRSAQKPGAAPEQRHGHAVASEAPVHQHRHDPVVREAAPDLERGVERLSHLARAGVDDRRYERGVAPASRSTWLT